MDVDTVEQLAAARAKVRAGQDIDEEELRLLVLALRGGRRSAAQQQKTKRAAKPPPISVSTLFRPAAAAPLTRDDTD